MEREFNCHKKVVKILNNDNKMLKKLNNYHKNEIG